MKDGILRAPLEGRFISWIKGRDHYSADAIMHTVRTNAVIDGHKGAKVNNNFVDYAARLYSE